VLLFGLIDVALFNYPRWTSAFAPAVAFIVVVGVPGALAAAAGFTLLQLNVADELRARTMSVLMVLESGAMLLGTVLAGNLTGKFGVITVLTGQGLGYVVAAIVWAVLARRMTGRVEARLPEPVPAG
jgi:hypothetical protein